MRVRPGMMRCIGCGADLGGIHDAPTSLEPATPIASSSGEMWGGFRLLEKVGQGSFGEVYRAFDTTLEREVALKLLLPGPGADDAAKSVLREARLLARVRHPNVVSVYGVDQFNGRVGFWSDFVHGRTLASLELTQGRFGAAETVQIGINVCKAVSAVHAAGLLHRDIKAGNVMREDGGRILLMDFGLSHEYLQDNSSIGTPAYMAPELFTGQPASVASDIYAVGVLLFRLLTGSYPVEALNLDEYRDAHLAGSRRLLYEERTDLPEQLVRVIETAVSPDPKKRFQSAGLMIAALSESAGVSVTATSAPASQKATHLSKWIAAAVVATLAAVAWFSPAAANFRARPAKTSSVASAEADYLKAEDLLDHYYRPRNIDNAIALFRKAAAEDPSSGSIYAGLGRALWWRYRDTHDATVVPAAKDACTRALELDRESVSAHVTLAMIHTDGGRLDLAGEELKQALGLNARSAEAYSALAELYQKEGRAAEVEPAIQKAIDLAPGAWRYLNQLGLYYLATGKNVAAADQFQRAAALNADNARAYNNLGIAYKRENRMEEARSAYEKSLKIDPTYFTLSNLGTIDLEQGKPAAAAEVFRRAVDMNPSSYVSWGNLANAQDKVPGGKAEARNTYLNAISIAEKARENAPDDWTVIADLAMYYALIDLPEKSLPLLRQAAALGPDNPQVLSRVAEGYELLHHRDEALKWIARALDAGLTRQSMERIPEFASLLKDPRFPGKSK